MKPNYDHSIISTIMSILNYYGADTRYKTNSKIDELLKGKPRNIILLILDGMGYDFIRTHFKNSSLCSHIIDKVTSTYPPTTTAAIKSYMSGLTPLEHGWLGWSPYFPNENLHIELLPYRDMETGLKPNLEYDIRDRLSFKTIFEQIHQINDKVTLHTNQPEYIDEHFPFTIRHNYENLTQMFSNIEDIIKSENNNFIYCYHDNPDFLMHEHGPSSDIVIEQFQKIIKLIDTFIAKNENSNTLFIISSDHGQIDIEKYIDFQEDKKMISMLVTYPSIESRFTSFLLKNKNQSEEFKSHFLKHYGQDYILMSKDELISSGYLGNGTPHQEVDSLLGDFVALATSKAMFINGNNSLIMKGHHAGTLPEEMYVPVIAFDLKSK